MPKFRYTAYDASGVKIEADLDSESLELARKNLESQSYHIVNLKEVSTSQFGQFRLGKTKVTLSELEFLTSELSILLASGVKIDKGLGILSKSNGSEAVDRLINDILKRLKQGASVADAFNTKDKVFDELYLNLISIGESTGRLPDIFDGLARDLKFRKDMTAKVTQALTYPSVILFVCIACILFVFNYIVPQMGSIFSEADDIPVYTQALIATSEWMRSYQLILFAGIGGLVGFAYYNKDNGNWNQSLSSRMLSVPVISDAIKQIETIRFNSAMSLMLDAGIKVDVAIGHACKNVRNHVLRKSLTHANENIKKGASVSTSLSQTPIFPSFFASLLEVGEESGRLQEIFAEIAMRSKTQFESWTTRITNVLEPLLIIVMGGIVGSVVVTMLLSVVSVNDVNL